MKGPKHTYALGLGGRCASVWHVWSSTPLGFEMFPNQQEDQIMYSAEAHECSH